MNIGLTGGIGCGKSTVLELFKGKGAATFDSDSCVRTLIEEDKALIDDLRRDFGSTIFAESRKVDRSKLASIVFSNSKELRKLERLIHPLVRQKWEEEIRTGHNCLVVEIPLLFEKGLQASFDFTICVVTEPEQQRQRLERRGWSEEHANQRLSQQWSLDKKAELADLVIVNNGSAAHLAEQIDYIFEHILVPKRD